MNLEHSFTVPVGIDEAWKILLDIELIGPCMPGATIESVDGDDFTGNVKVKLGPIGLTYKGKASFVEKDAAAHRAVIDARGRDARGNGTASAKVTAVLAEQGGSTLVKVDTDLDITGKPAQFGRGVMVDVGNKLIGQFADNLAATIGSDSGGTPAPAAKAAPAKKTARPKPAVDDTTAVPAAAGAAIDEAAVSAVGEAPAAFSTPGSDTAVTPLPDGAEDTAAEPSVSDTPAVNGHQPAHAAAPKRDAEPINLLESAGPAVAKRLAPIAGAAVIVVLIVVRQRRKGRRRR